MPENTLPPGAANAAEHNAKIAVQVAAQDQSGRANNGPTTLDTSKALDAWAEQVSKEREGAAAQVQPKEQPSLETDAKVKADAEVAAKADAEAKAKADANAQAKAKADANAQAKAKADADAQAKAKADADANEYFKDLPSLPAGASPKSTEAFTSVKLKAAQEISAREQQIVKLQEELKVAKEAASKPTPEQEQEKQELTSLREWRAKLDVDFDPRFKTFDTGIGKVHDFIYAQLRKSPAVNEEVIAQIKRLGGPENVNLGTLFEAIKDPTMQRIVESKVAEVEQMKFEKEQAVKVAKENLGTYLKERQTQLEGESVAEVKATQEQLSGLLKAMPWLSEKQAGEKSTEADKKAVLEHNAFVKQLQGEIGEAVKDKSPLMRAILVAAYAQLMQLRRTSAATEGERDALKKELGEVQEKYDRVRSASVNRLRESNAPPSGQLPKPSVPNIFRPASDALDEIAKQVMEERAAKASAAA